MEYKNILNEFFFNNCISYSKGKRLIVLLGSFADFDSFEYCQHLSAKSKMLIDNSVDLIVIGIGSEKSKETFCRFNKLDIKKVIAVSNCDLHNKLNLNRGLELPLPAIMNLLIMCAGINSRGTLKEVIRGYLGDNNASRLFDSDEDIRIGRLNFFKGKMFEVFSKKNTLRPFELATRRLLNMIEILTNWNTYVPDPSVLTQRGATILINENDEILYKFFSESLLGYSNRMSTPLSFLDEFIN